MKENHLVITGNLGKDPKLTFSKSGTAIVQFSIAAPQSKKENGQWIDLKPIWFQVTFFKEEAEAIMDKFSKGDTARIEGRLAQSEYEKDGETKTSLEIIGASISKIERVKQTSEVLNKQSEEAPF